MNKILLLILFTAAALFCQNNKNVIATVGNEKIDQLDFKARYELMPHVSENRSPDSLKKEFLFSLIGEKLWAIEAINKGLDTTDYFKSTFEPLRKMYLKDALFQEEVTDKIRISPDELATGIFRSRVTLDTYIFPFSDSLSAQKLYSLLNKKIKIDSLLNLYKLKPEDITKITYGKMEDPSVETILYKLKPGQFTSPLKIKNNWFVFYMVNKAMNTETGDDELNNKVRGLLKEKKSRDIGMAFLKKFFAEIKSDVNKQLFEELANLIEQEINKKIPDDYEKKQGVIYLDEASVDDIIRNSKNLYATFFSYNSNNNVSLKSFLYSLKFEPLKFTKKTKNEISLQLKKRIDNFIEQELLSAEAVKRGLDKKDSVVRDLYNWKESYLCQMLRNSFLGKSNVNEEELYQYYLKRLNKIDTVAQVNILEILTDKLEIVEIVLNELNNGKDFRELAKLYTKREWTKNKGGEFGFFPVTQFQQLSNIAVNMKIGDVYGPIKTEEGYSIIKLIDKKDAVHSFTGAFDKVKDDLRNELAASKLKDAFEEETVKLSYKYGASVNWSNLSQLKLNDIPMFTYRYMGFGGRIAAVPYTTPWYNWVKKEKLIF